MNWLKFFVTSSCLLISFTNVLQPLQAQINESGNINGNERIIFVPAETDDNPKKYPPDGTGGGGHRGCSLEQKSSNELLQALVPNVGVVGHSASDYPTFWVYIPYSTTSELYARLSVRDEKDKAIPTIKSMRVTLSGIPGIVKLPLPKTLENGKMYHWFLTVICDPDRNDESANPVVSGWVRQVKPNTSLMNQLNTASPRERAVLYAKAGYWYEAITILADIRQAALNDPQAAADWADLLQSVKLEAIVNKPIVPCCTLP